MEVEKEKTNDSNKKDEQEQKKETKDIDAPLEKQYIMDVDDDKEEPDERAVDPTPSARIVEDVDTIVAETVSSGKLVDGIERLLVIEKKQRQVLFMFYVFCFMFMFYDAQPVCCGRLSLFVLRFEMHISFCFVISLYDEIE